MAAVANGTADTIYLVYSDLNLIQSYACANPANRITRTVTWWLSISTNSGSTWAHHKITTDNKWPQCITDQDNGSNRTRAPIAFSSSGRILTAISRSQTNAAGKNVGLRSVLYQYPNAAGAAAFDSWIPLCNSAACPPGSASCLVSGTLPASETYCNQYGQEIATTNTMSGASAAMVWHDTRDTATPSTPTATATPQYLNLQVSIWGASVQPGSPYDANPQTQSRLTPLGAAAGVPWTQTSTLTPGPVDPIPRI
jgi:hypothetical protein